MRVGCSTLLFCVMLVAAAPAAAQQTVGLFVNESPQPGYVLFGPMGGTTTYLISNDGLVVNSWSSAFRPALMAYLLESGHLLRSARLNSVDPHFTGAGRGGRVEEFDWEGNLVWSFDYNTFDHLSHHDIEPMPGGNVLLIAWDWMSADEAIAAGRNPATVGSGLWIDSVVEVEPTLPVGGTVVWEWHARDHLIQDFDVTKANFGVVGDHPELVDFNAGGSGTDWTHANGVDYNAELDQIAISIRALDEVWIIDHSTTTAEAAGHTGGNSNRGGDILYRWGNPQNYDRGTAADQLLFGQHDVQWVSDGSPGAGNLIVYSNGNGRPEGNYSTIEEFTPTVDQDGAYAPLAQGQAHGPASTVWTYVADPPGSLFSPNVSGVERQPNGNTLICEGSSGHLFEVDAADAVVWDYVSPATGGPPVDQGNFASFNSVFKVRRYPPDFPGLIDRDLTPGDPLEGFESPFPVPGSSLRVGKALAGGSSLTVDWDASACTSHDYNLLYGDLAHVSSMTVDGADCSIGVSGGITWTGVPSGSLFFFVVGTDGTAVYESSWGRSSDGAERGGTTASFECDATTKVVTAACP